MSYSKSTVFREHNMPSKGGGITHKGRASQPSSSLADPLRAWPLPGDPQAGDGPKQQGGCDLI